MSDLRVIIASLALVCTGLMSCSADPNPVSSSQLQGSETFLRTVEEARRHIRFGDLAAAGQSYDEALELEPENPGLWVDIARLRFMGGEHLTAIEAADYALELGPNYAPALLLRGQMVRDANGMEESLPWFEAAAAAAPNDPEILGEYAATLGDLGYNRDMLAAVRDLTDFAPDDPQAQYLQSVMAARADRPELATRLLERSGFTEDEVPAARLLSAIVNLQQGNFDTAANTLETLAGDQPGNVRVQELLARAWWLGGRDSLITERFAAAAELPDSSTYLTMLVGRAFERLGDRPRAIPFFEKASRPHEQTRFTLAPGNSLPDVSNRLRGLVSQRNLDQSRGVSTQFIRRYPQSGDAYSLAGDVALAGNDPLAAAEFYKVSAKVRRSWPLTRKLAAAMLQVGEGEAAKALLARYAQGDPQNLDALLFIAKLSAKEADWLRVQVLLDTAIAQGAGSDPVVLTLRAKAARELGNEADASQVKALLQDVLPGPFL
ncbi:MAG: tetratricopeptide repeat protein [Pseudomonadota bacterium]